MVEVESARPLQPLPQPPPRTELYQPCFNFDNYKITVGLFSRHLEYIYTFLTLRRLIVSTETWWLTVGYTLLGKEGLNAQREGMVEVWDVRSGRPYRHYRRA